ncbi:MAG: hypothetical protein F6K24_01950 [Okeania sp. SIO2D1]|nr:hypothetical protein [Okeania sp. SIO2D1]
MNYDRELNQTNDLIITQQKKNSNTHINICKYCNSSNLSTKPALAKGYEKIFCNNCGKYQGLVKAIASNNNQEVGA